MKHIDQLEPNAIYQGDSRDLLPKVASHSVRLIHTSPPYNIGRRYNAYEDSKPLQEYTAFITQIVGECYRVLAPGGSMFWQTGYTSDAESSDYIYPVDHLTFKLFLTAGFRLKDRVIWRYFGGMAFKRKFTNRHETILWWVKPGADVIFNVFPVRERSKEFDARNNLFGRNPGNVWEVDRVAFGSTEQSSHIAVFPEEISERLVLSASEEGDLCIDPFSGSGTLCKVAKSRGRRFIGIEMDETYAEESRIRLGFCQSSEFDNVLSQILKDHVFRKSGTALPIERVTDHLLLLLNGEAHPPAQPISDQDHLTRIRCMEENGIPKRQKVILWKELEQYFDVGNRSDPLIVVDSSYLRCFRYDRMYNAVMRFLLADRWLTKFRQIARHPATLQEYILHLAANEPSSYGRRGKHITLTSMARDIQAAAELTRPSREKIAVGLELGLM